MAKTRRQKREEAQLRNDIRHIAESEAGRRFVRRLLGMTGVYSVNRSGDPFTEGQRAVGLGLIDMLNAVDPYLYARLLTEASSAEVRAANMGDDDNVDDDEQD